MFFKIFLLHHAFTFLQSDAYCWQPGWNPSFTGPPSILQLDLTTIWISWKGLVVNSECADQYVVKYWPSQTPEQYLPILTYPTNVTSVKITNVPPRVPHTYQIIAREDKGRILGIEYNRSPAVSFSTSGNSFQPPADSIAPKTDGNQVLTKYGRDGKSMKFPEDRSFTETEEQSEQVQDEEDESVGLPSDGSGDTFLWLGIGLGCLVGVICIGGVACKFVRPFVGGKLRKTGTSNTQVENQNHDCGDMVDSDFESY